MKDDLYAEIPGGPRDICTMLFYDVSDAQVDQSHNSAQSNDVNLSSRRPLLLSLRSLVLLFRRRRLRQKATGSGPCPRSIRTWAQAQGARDGNDMEDFFKSCVQAYAELTDTDPATYPKSGTPFGPELTSLED